MTGPTREQKTEAIVKARALAVGSLFLQGRHRCEKRGHHEWVAVDAEGRPAPAAKGAEPHARLCRTCFKGDEEP